MASSRAISMVYGWEVRQLTVLFCAYTGVSMSLNGPLSASRLTLGFLAIFMRNEEYLYGIRQNENHREQYACIYIEKNDR